MLNRPKIVGGLCLTAYYIIMHSCIEFVNWNHNFQVYHSTGEIWTYNLYDERINLFDENWQLAMNIESWKTVYRSVMKHDVLICLFSTQWHACAMSVRYKIQYIDVIEWKQFTT